jgi:hypothetical protein
MMDILWIIALIAVVIVAIAFLIGRITVRYALMCLGVVAALVVLIWLLLPIIARHT